MIHSKKVNNNKGKYKLLIQGTEHTSSFAITLDVEACDLNLYFKHHLELFMLPQL
ncbi:hypothetical protein N482_24575 [Pseudoalteromonas luteoviolacea NCIMB 1942]|uniref:Uncharacterized protein n=1 Tax=Pseudoalteromonas luteoviolacea NCIMB 1942 TaxID=1365253 RepID=A0A167G890_9GAMM|nr:hypothetical protein N482_24575 [Pseudoalteromonas luteoviolacea NCIMB 1942]